MEYVLWSTPGNLVFDIIPVDFLKVLIVVIFDSHLAYVDSLRLTRHQFVQYVPAVVCQDSDKIACLEFNSRRQIYSHIFIKFCWKLPFRVD